MPNESRVRKPDLDNMGPGTDRPVPRRPNVDTRTKAGAFGENVKGPHKPTLDEMGPHASLPVKNAKGSLPRSEPDADEDGRDRNRRRKEKPPRPLEENRPAGSVIHLSPMGEVERGAAERG